MVGHGVERASLLYPNLAPLGAPKPCYPPRTDAAKSWVDTTLARHFPSLLAHRAVDDRASEGKDDRAIVVVGVVGKSEQGKGEFANAILDRPAATTGSVPPGVRMVYQPHRRRVLVCCDGPFDGPSLMGAVARVEQAQAAAGGGTLAGLVEDDEFGHMKALLFLFMSCHIVLYTVVGHTVDMQLLRTLRVLQSLKQSLSTHLASAIFEGDAPEGRLGMSLLPTRYAPRLIFVFRVRSSLVDWLPESRHEQEERECANQPHAVSVLSPSCDASARASQVLVAAAWVGHGGAGTSSRRTGS